MPPKAKNPATKATAKRKRKEEVESGSDDCSDGGNDDSSNSGESDVESSNDDDDDDLRSSVSSEICEDSDGGDSSNGEEDEEEPALKKPRSSDSKISKKRHSLTKNKGRNKESKLDRKKHSKKSSNKTVDTIKVPKIKSLKKSDRLEEARKAYKWWEAETHPNGINWKYLEHPGICFPSEYIPHGVPLMYDGKEIKLNKIQEEIASFFASMPLDGPQLGNPKTKSVFEKNFFDDFKETLGPSHIIRSFEKCDFTLIREHLQLQKDIKKAATDEEKKLKKDEKEHQILRYGYALIDGRLEKMGNYNMEPPGLFRGRGEHPKTGKLKARCFPETVSLNLSEDACVPICNVPGHAWECVRHDPAVTWLCSWNENVQNQNKYVMLAASSSFKGKSDQEKYDKAIKLRSCIDKIRKDYTSKLKDTSSDMRELGTAMWVIDKLALRVGGEKGEDEADTVGCCSLRVEHLTFSANSESYEIELEFLGKDSMLYKQNINFALYGETGKSVHKNLKNFCKGKRHDEQVFESLTPPVLNKHLNSLMKGLTAKVFRTFNASVTLEQELPRAEDLDGLSVQDKVLRYNAANRQVAILCNHQRSVSKATETMFENLNEKLQTLLNQRTELLEWKEFAKKSKINKIPLKEDDRVTVEKVQSKLQSATERKETAKTLDEKLSAAQALEVARAEYKQDQKRRFEEKHKFKAAPSLESLESRIDKWTDDIRKLETDIRNRDENKEVALGTSKINYMDPRISVAWCKRCEVPIDKVFARTLRDKFNWAMAVSPDWKFE